MSTSECIDHGNRPGVEAYDNGRHIAALAARTGEAPAGRFALHTCDNKRCINGEHLYWGTAQDNMNDKMLRGRWQGGGPRHLNVYEVQHIREAHAAGSTYSALGRLYHKSPGVIYQIVQRITYKDIE